MKSSDIELSTSISNESNDDSINSVIVIVDDEYIISDKIIISEFTSTSSSKIIFNIGGSQSNSKIIVNGNATFDGTLKLDFEDDYIPKDRELIELIQYGKYSGKFNDVCLF